MLRYRIVPIVLINGYSVLKTIKFKTRRNLGNPITVARTYNTRNVDELVLLDIDASVQSRSIDLFTIKEIASECFMPLTVGGGLSSCQSIRNVLENGGDKVAINSEAIARPEFVREASSMFGSQCIVVSIDLIATDGKYRVFSRINSDNTLEPLEWCKRVEHLGAGEILLNFVNLDGTMSGCDSSYIATICEALRIPVIAAGGISRPADCCIAIEAGASAVGASSIFHFTGHTPNDCKEALRERGLLVR